MKGLVPCSPVPLTEPLDTDNDTTKAKDTEASTDKNKDLKPPSPKTIKSDSSPSCHSSSHQASSCEDLTREKKIVDEDIKEEKDDKDVAKNTVTEEKMDVDINVEPKKEKNGVRKSTKPPRPSSTPPTNAGISGQCIRSVLYIGQDLQKYRRVQTQK